MNCFFIRVGRPFIALAAILMGMNTLHGAELPNGEGVELVRQQCGICHNLDLVVQQKLNEETWAGVLDDMQKFGAPFNPKQRATLLAYLVQHFGAPDGGDNIVMTLGGLPKGEGVDLVRVQCGICHNLDLVRSQRLSRDVWEEVLDDMRIFGAPFDDIQKETLLNYLSKHLTAR